MPYINASRCYQQLNQIELSKIHLNYAIKLDSTLAMTYVDIAQQYAFQGSIDIALELLMKALDLAKHVSEICDVLTAKVVTEIQKELQLKDIYRPPALTFKS